MKKMEVFKNNLENEKFSSEFIQLALNYFNELIEEMEIQEVATVEEIIDYYAKIGSFTCNTLKSENNLKELREDINRLYAFDLNNILNLMDYFQDIENFELQVLYVLYFEFFRTEEEEEENL